MSKNAARLFFPENHLATMLERAHGRPREDAVAAATVRLQAQQEMAMAAIQGLITGLEASDVREPDRIGHDADRIVTLAEAFGLAQLADAARRLCDLVAMLRQRNRRAPDALSVHIQALRLFAPDSPIGEDTEAALVLSRIAALAAHLSSHL
jgi:hypothetical protein